jgi:hypothetical protein
VRYSGFPNLLLLKPEKDPPIWNQNILCRNEDWDIRQEGLQETMAEILSRVTSVPGKEAQHITL